MVLEFSAVVCGLTGKRLLAYFAAQSYPWDGVYARFNLAYRSELGLDHAMLVLAHNRVTEPMVFKLGLKVDGAMVRVIRELWEERDGLKEAIAHAKKLATGKPPSHAYAITKPRTRRRCDEYPYQGE